MTLSRLIKSFAVFASVVAICTSVWGQVLPTQISISLDNAVPNRFVSLTIIDEVNKRLVFQQGYVTATKSLGTDSSGSFRQVINGLNSAHTFTITLKIDVDGSGAENIADLGETQQGLSPGATIHFTNLTGLRALTPQVANNIALKNQKALCFLFSAQYDQTSLTLGGSIGYLGVIQISYDQSGKATTRPMFMPSSKYGNIMCFIDRDSSRSLTSGDLYQFIDGNFSFSLAVTDFTLKAWSTH